ncbi:MAG: cobalamin biosynthesis protein CobW [Thermosynechococcaceae cyanobacterium]
MCPEDSETANSPNVVELTNGCLCCTVQEEFLPTMLELLKRRESIDCILVETSGLALPKPLVQAFRWPEIRNAATVDGVITVVDCDAVASGQLVGDLDALEAQRQADPNLDHETPLEELFEDQLACADLVILNKTDCVDPATQAKVRAFIQAELPRSVKIVASAHSTLAPDVLLGFNAAVEDDLHNRPSHHDHEADHEHDEEITSAHVVLNQTFNPKALQAQLAELVVEQEIYRIKGFVHVARKPMRLVLQGVGQRFDQFYDRPWATDELRQTKLVFIGKAIDTAAIERRLSLLPA